MKILKGLQLSTVKVALLLGLMAATNMANAGTQMKVYLITGSDDLRGNGNYAYITINYTNGTTSPEYNLGGGFTNNSRNIKNVTINLDVTSLSQIKNIVIRHNGSPRSGFPADTYDNWDLQSLRMSFIIGGTEQIFMNESGSPLVRFTGKLRNRTFLPTAAPPDLGDKTNKVKVYLTTGSDDLRGGGNYAFMTINYTDGTTSPEYNLGGGFGQNTAVTKAVTIGKVVATVSEIKNIVIRHDGNPRSGQPFDSYDNWDLQMLRVALVMPNGVEQNIINERGNPLCRFTGALRTRTWIR